MKDCEGLEDLTPEERELLDKSDEQIMRESADAAWAMAQPPVDSYEAWIQGWIAGHKEGFSMGEKKWTLIRNAQNAAELLKKIAEQQEGE